MPLLSKTQFARLANCRVNHIATYARRGKLYIASNGTLDTENALNALFIKSRAGKEPPAELEVKKKTNGKPVDDVEKTVLDNLDIDRQKKELDVQIRERDLMMKDINIQKLNGELIPTDLVAAMLKIYVKQLQLELKYALDRMVVDLVKKLGGNNVDIARARGNVVEYINQGTSKARAGMNDQLEAIVNEYKKSK